MRVSATDCYALKIGTKGEIFPPKELRERLGMVQGQSILLSVEGDKIIIRKLESVENLLSGPSKVVISPHAIKNFRHDLSEELEH